MALEVPRDVPSNQFIHAGLMVLDGGLFNGDRRISSQVLAREIDYIKYNATKADLQTKGVWQQVRNVCLLWCFSYRTMMDTKAVNNLLTCVGLHDLNISTATLPQIFEAVEKRYNQSVFQPLSPAPWIKARPPPQRLPSSNSATGSAQGSPQPYPINYQSPFDVPGPFIPTVHPQIAMPVFFDQNGHNQSIVADVDLNSNPAFQGRYFFTEHKQEYDGYQFQCFYRCLKDGKHCRKAPVREMNRHLRERHYFRPGFKVAGVDWENKRWRGAGADHRELVGKIVEKDAADDSDDSDDGNNGSGGNDGSDGD